MEEQRRKAQELQEEKERQEAQRKKEWEEQQAEIQKQKKYECIKVKTDEFRDITTIALKKDLGLDTIPRITADVDYIVGHDDILMRFVSLREVSWGWRFLKYHEVYFLIDGERWHPEEDYNSDLWSSSHTLYETISISIPLERMESIVHAQSVRFQIGGEEFKFSKDHQDKMGILLEYLREYYNTDEIIQKHKQMQETIQGVKSIVESYKSAENEELEAVPQTDEDAN